MFFNCLLHLLTCMVQCPEVLLYFVYMCMNNRTCYCTSSDVMMISEYLYLCEHFCNLQNAGPNPLHVCTNTHLALPLQQLIILPFSQPFLIIPTNCACPKIYHLPFTHLPQQRFPSNFNPPLIPDISRSFKLTLLLSYSRSMFLVPDKPSPVLFTVSFYRPFLFFLFVLISPSRPFLVIWLIWAVGVAGMFATVFRRSLAQQCCCKTGCIAALFSKSSSPHKKGGRQYCYECKQLNMKKEDEEGSEKRTVKRFVHLSSGLWWTAFAKPPFWCSMWKKICPCHSLIVIWTIDIVHNHKHKYNTMDNIYLSTAISVFLFFYYYQLVVYISRFCIVCPCLCSLFPGMYAIKFVREFKLCCCCYKKTWTGGQRYVYREGDRVVNPVKPIASTKGTSCSASSSCTVKDAATAVTSASAAYDGPNATENGTASPLANSRSITPPHIAQGRGTRVGFDKYLMIWMELWILLFNGKIMCFDKYLISWFATYSSETHKEFDLRIWVLFRHFMAA